MRLFRSRIFVAALFLIHLVPLWYFDYLPFNDYPNHLARLQIQRDYDDSDFYREHFILEPFRGTAPIPNLTLDIFVNGLMSSFDVDTAMRCFISLYVIFYLFGIYLLSRELNLDFSLILLVNIPLAFSFFLHLGVLGFLFSIPLFFFAVYLFERHEKTRSPRDILLIGVLSLLIYITHIISFFVFCFFVACRFFTMRDRLREYAHIVLASFPAMVLTLNYLLSGTGGSLYLTTFRNRLQLSLITFSHLPRTYIFISIALFASALFLILKNSSLRNRFYPAMAIILFTGSLLMPIDGMSGSFIYGRFFLYSFILLSFGMDAVEGRQVDLARLFLVLVCLIGFSWLVQYCREFNRDFSTVCSGAIRERSVLMTVDVTRSRSLIRPFNSAWGYFLQKKAFLDYSVICGINQQIKYRTSRPDLNRYGDGQGQGEVRGPLRAIRESYDYVLLFGKDRNVEERLDSISEKVCSDRMVSLYKLQRLTGPVLRN